MSCSRCPAIRPAPAGVCAPNLRSPAPFSARGTRARYCRQRRAPTACAVLGPQAAAAAAAASAAVAAAEAAAGAPLASVVPTFPRFGGQPVRDWIGEAVQQLPGFSAEDLTRLLFPDLVGLVDGRSLLIGGLLVLALLYLEGGLLVRRLLQRQQQQKRGVRSEGDSGAAADEAAREAAPLPPPSPMDRARYERRRGLGWLALVTAGLIWMTGVVSGPSPFQP